MLSCSRSDKRGLPWFERSWNKGSPGKKASGGLGEVHRIHQTVSPASIVRSRIQGEIKACRPRVPKSVNGILQVTLPVSTFLVCLRTLVFTYYNEYFQYRVESYQHCIDDVEAALHYLGSSGHHDDDYILLDRKAKCLMASNGNPSHTLELFSQALEAAASSSTIPEMMNTAFQKQVKANMEKLLKETKDANDTNDLTTSAYDINLNKRHGKHPSMSNKLSINYSPGRGRYLD